jgi:hypothetical protein
MTGQHIQATPPDIDMKEKVETTFGHIEKIDSNGSGADTEQAQILSPDDFTPEEERRLLRRIDMKILPLVTGKIDGCQILVRLWLISQYSLILALLLGSNKHRSSQHRG